MNSAVQRVISRTVIFASLNGCPVTRRVVQNAGDARATAFTPTSGGTQAVLSGFPGPIRRLVGTPHPPWRRQHSFEHSIVKTHQILSKPITSLQAEIHGNLFDE